MTINSEIVIKHCPLCDREYEYLSSEAWRKEHPSQELVCSNCDPFILNTISRPSWIQESERILNTRKTDDPNLESKATEVYQDMREKEIQSSTKSRNWEESRKKELAAYKPTWVKKGRNTKELSVITKV